MRRILPLALLLSLTIAPVIAQEVFFFPQVGDGAVPGIRFQTTVIFVNTGEATVLTLEFFGQDGQPLPIDLPPLGINSFFNINLPAGESFSGQTPGTGSLQVGYARVTSPTPGVGGTAVFTQSNPETGQIVYDAGVPASQALTEFSLFVDNSALGSRRTGLATVNAGDAPANVTMRLNDRAMAFGELAMTDKPLGIGEHLPRFVDELIDDPLLADQVREMEGVLTVSSDQPLAAVVLRQNASALTAFPVVPGIATPAASGSFAFLPDGQVGTSLDVSKEEDTVIGVIYRLYDGDSLLAAISRGIVSPEASSNHRLPVGDQMKLVNRVQALIVYAGGRLSSGFDLVSG